MAQSSTLEVAQAIDKLSKQFTGKKLAKAIAAFIVSERRTADLDKIMRKVSLIRQKGGKSEVTVTSAFPITDEAADSIKQIVDGNNVTVNKVIDKSVIGGVRLEANDLYLDLTVRNRLNKLKIGVS